jgi:hypothetical protein
MPGVALRVTGCEVEERAARCFARLERVIAVDNVLGWAYLARIR